MPGNAAVQQYLSVSLQRPAGRTSTQPGSTVGQSAYTYNANDASVADLDGDGVYEIILKWDPTNSRDTASAGLSGPVIIDAYKMDGTRLWRIDLGKNIRAGAHYTQFLVYDLDGDGKAELVCKTADGTTDGAGTVIGDGTKDYRSLIAATDSYIPVTATSDVRFGKILAGPEFLTVFDGETVAAMARRRTSAIWIRPDRDLEVFGVHETENTTNPAFQSPGSTLHDARTGEILWTNNPATDVGRGNCADIDLNFVGAECWARPAERAPLPPDCRLTRRVLDQPTFWCGGTRICCANRKTELWSRNGIRSPRPAAPCCRQPARLPITGRN